MQEVNGTVEVNRVVGFACNFQGKVRVQYINKIEEAYTKRVSATDVYFFNVDCTES